MTNIGGSGEEVSPGKLYLVATPIGNLQDLSPRVAQTLAEVDYIAAEDTRELQKLLNHLSLKKSVLSYHHHNRQKATQQLLQLLHRGKSIALVSDAGMPLISDPGEELVAAVWEQGLPLTVIPGPSAGLTALTLSGFSCNRFVFEGFLPTGEAKRRLRLLALQGEERSCIIYEAPHRLAQTMQDLVSYLGGERRGIIARELTKIYEEVVQGSLADLQQHLAQTPPRGEYVLVIAGAEEVEPPAMSDTEAQEQYRELVAAGWTRRDALKEAARRSGIGRDRLYQILQEQSP
ncbi:MAG: 16S rRNA (cytidine(1402)-2'-O)-methyltransferase [Symbiobacteriaceae bacterium]|nr:16S rRNA (cytidine(1402)-2'-O)-methyltransferase [Symbiobacteriaceae bacterium]